MVNDEVKLDDFVKVVEGLAEEGFEKIVLVSQLEVSGKQWSYLGQHSPITYWGSQSNRNLQSASAQVIELPWQ